ILSNVLSVSSSPRHLPPSPETTHQSSLSDSRSRSVVRAGLRSEVSNRRRDSSRGSYRSLLTPPSDPHLPIATARHPATTSTHHESASRARQVSARTRLCTPLRSVVPPTVKAVCDHY